jgi:uncharacterized surface protein with fasciclin (FAS1) repeats
MHRARRLVATLAATGLAAAGTLATAPGASALSEGEAADFVGQLTASYNDPTTSNDRNPYDFDIVTKAAIATGAVDVLAGLDSFTLFAPNDRAFEVLAKRLGLLGANHRFGPTVDEGKVFNALLEELGAGTITNVLLYHVVPGVKADGATVLGLFGKPKAARTLTTAFDGQTLRVDVLSPSPRFPLIVLVDRDGRYFNDLVVKSKIDAVETPNTVVHGISDVLLPTL